MYRSRYQYPVSSRSRYENSTVKTSGWKILYIVVVIIIVIVTSLILIWWMFKRARNPPVSNNNTNQSNSIDLQQTNDKIIEASDKIVAAIKSEGDQTQVLLAQITAGIDVNLLPLSGTVQSQLEALIGSALTTSGTLNVNVQNFSGMQSVLEAALTYAANNLQFTVLATQNGSWTVDLSLATINAIQTAFQNALGNVSVNVNIQNNPVTVELTGANLAALQNTTVNIAGQPISVTLPGPIALDTAIINAIASAVAGQNFNVTVTGQPLSITGTVNLGDVSSLTNWFNANNLNINDTAIIASINGIGASIADITNDDVSVLTTPSISAGCNASGVAWTTFFERKYNEVGTLISSTQYWTNGTTLTTTLPVGLSNSNCPTSGGGGGGGNSTVVTTPSISAGCTVSGVQWNTYFERKFDPTGAIVSNIQYWTNGTTLTTTAPSGLSFSNCPLDGNDTVVVTPAVDVGCTAGSVKWYTFFERKYNEVGTLISSTQYWTNGNTLTTTQPAGLSNNNCGTGTIVSLGAPNVKGNCRQFQGNTVQQLGLPAGTKGTFTFLSSVNNGRINFTFNGTTPTANDPELRNNDTGYLNVRGVDLSQLRLLGQNNNTRYTVCYEEYLP